MKKKVSLHYRYSWHHYLAVAFLLLGVLLRIGIYALNRNLYIDEANVARNIYEQGFIQLLSPLKYQQYAPPVFLWVVKLCSLIGGFGERVLRFYPLICSLFTLVLFYKLLLQLRLHRSAWYAIALLAISFIQLRYGTELKQYSSDVMVTIGLYWWALKNDILNLNPKRFFGRWLPIGSLAIWMSMPSVFILFAIGLYYVLVIWQSKDWHKVTALIVVALLWLLQFALYYILVLNDQSNSEYLQTFHDVFFFKFDTLDLSIWQHNGDILKSFINEATGFHVLCFLVTIILLTFGISTLFSSKKIFWLLLTPIFITIIAGGLRLYSWFPRLVLFLMPCVYVIVAYGFEKLFDYKHKLIKPLLLIAATTSLIVLCGETISKKPWENEELTQTFEILKKERLNSNSIYVHNIVSPVWLYYTEIHPCKQQWSVFNDVYHVPWFTNIDSLAENSSYPVTFVFAQWSEDRESILQSFQKHASLVWQHNHLHFYAYQFAKP